MNTIGLKCLECRSLDAIALAPPQVSVIRLLPIPHNKLIEAFAGHRKCSQLIDAYPAAKADIPELANVKHVLGYSRPG
jgi:hypothetical protein